MKIRFVEITPSLTPGFPFQPGQTIEVAKLTPELRKWIKEGHAVLVKQDPPEHAVTEGRGAA